MSGGTSAARAAHSLHESCTHPAQPPQPTSSFAPTPTGALNKSHGNTTFSQIGVTFSQIGCRLHILDPDASRIVNARLESLYQSTDRKTAARDHIKSLNTRNA